MKSSLDDLFTVLRFQSISTDLAFQSEVRANAEWLQEKLCSLGFASTLHETKKHPIVLAKSAPQAGKPTVLLYGHYDVQPVDPLSLWETPPFEPTLIEGRIFARGATDNKGQHMAHLRAIEELIAAQGELPVNLIVLFEGEEEIGSPNLTPFLEEHRDELRCDTILVSDTGMVAPGTGTLGYGLRGILCCEVFLEGPRTDQHSGCFGGAVANPATELARLIATLHQADGQVAIAGFYDSVRPLEQWERDMWSTVPGMDEESLLTLTGSPSLHGEVGYSSAERLWARPTAEVNGMGSGYQGEGSKTVLPAHASCKLSFRLVPGQEPDSVFALVQAHLKKHVSPHVRCQVKQGHGGAPYYNDPQSAYGKAAQRALRQTYQKEPVLIREGGSIPIISDFKRILGVDTLMLGLALPDAQIHAPNENFPVESFLQGVTMSKAVLTELGALSSPHCPQ